MVDFKDQSRLNRTLEVVDLPKSSWYDARRKKDDDARYGYLREPLMEIAEAYPEYGCCRTTPELHPRGYHFNHKVVKRLHLLWNLLVMKKIKSPKPKTIIRLLKELGDKINLVARLKTIEELEVLSADFKEIIYKTWSEI